MDSSDRDWLTQLSLDLSKLTHENMVLRRELDKQITRNKQLTELITRLKKEGGSHEADI